MAMELQWPAASRRRTGKCTAAVTGDVTYSVSASCNASGIVVWSNGFTSHFKFYLDEIDTAPETNVAYHATAVFWSANTGISGQGSLTRRYGKFN
jgi:hypothetical protein